MPKHKRYSPEFATLSTLRNLHPERGCKGEVCVIHNPTEHHMRRWPLRWRRGRRMFERVCEHGYGHPDPDQLAHWEATGREDEAVHGCCGCCVPPRQSDGIALPLERYLPAPVRHADNPKGSPGIGLYRHSHIWGIVSTIRHRNGSVSPVYRCAVCRDVVYDSRQSLGGVDPDTGDFYSNDPWWEDANS